MSQAFYRKYRSKNLSEVVGQDHITSTLSQAVAAGNISHAYLFTGPRGVGKTSVARILAHDINKLPYDEEKPHIDIIEIDAASNRRIDEIRDIRDKVHIAPASATYKVYIIDEVHMLTKEAFNALLKTLEEPPAHVVFILATTEAHKLPETIISRTQRYNFKPIDDVAAAGHLAKIAKQEGIEASKEALELIAAYGKGSFRDSISLLDQLASSGQAVELETVRALLGVPAGTAVSLILETMLAGRSDQLLTQLQDLRASGIAPATIAEEVAKQLRDRMVQGSLSGSEVNLALLDKLIEVPAKSRPYDYLELALLSVALARQSPADTPAEVPKPPHVEAPAVQPDNQMSPPAELTKPEVKPAQPVIVPKPSPNVSVKSQLDDKVWNAVLTDIKKNYATIYGIMRMSRPRLEAGELLLEFGFPFHHKQINQAANRQKIASIIATHLGDGITITTAVNSELNAPDVVLDSQPEIAPDSIGSITNIFGGGEVLES